MSATRRERKGWVEERTNLEAAFVGESLDLLFLEVESDDGPVRRATVKGSTLVRPRERKKRRKRKKDVRSREALSETSLS